MNPEELLRRNHLLAICTPGEIAALAEAARRRTVRAGTVLFRRGDKGDGLYGVMAGRIDVAVESESGREMVINSFGPGEVFGEIALLDGKGRTAAAVAHEASELLFLSRRAFMPFLEARPKLATRMIVLLCDRLRRTTQLLEDSSFLGVGARLAKELLARAEDAPHDGGAVAIATSQGELALGFGVSREIVSRQLLVWRDAGLIELARGRITIRDVAAFTRAIAGG